MTVATWITIGRAALVLAVGACALTASVPRVGPWPLPGILYGLAVLGDVLDGWVARRLGQVTNLGARLDVEVDALGLLVASLTGLRTGVLPPWYLLLGSAYYLVAVGRWWRRLRGLPLFPERLAPYPLARSFAAAQMLFVTLALLGVLPPSVATAAAGVVMLPTLALFLREWRLVTRVD